MNIEHRNNAKIQPLSHTKLAGFHGSDICMVLTAIHLIGARVPGDAWEKVPRLNGCGKA